MVLYLSAIGRREAHATRAGFFCTRAGNEARPGEKGYLYNLVYSVLCQAFEAIKPTKEIRAIKTRAGLIPTTAERSYFVLAVVLPCAAPVVRSFSQGLEYFRRCARSGATSAGLRVGYVPNPNTKVRIYFYLSKYIVTFVSKKV